MPDRLRAGAKLKLRQRQRVRDAAAALHAVVVMPEWDPRPASPADDWVDPSLVPVEPVARAGHVLGQLMTLFRAGLLSHPEQPHG